MSKKVSLLILYLSLISCGLIPNTYLAAPISGTVVDEETELPLKDVHVVVYWKLHKGGVGGRVASDILHVEETITDENGEYYFKGWGPVNTISGSLGYESPELLYFKPGYYSQSKGNSRTQMYFGKRGAGEIHISNAEKTDTGMLYRSQWAGVNIYLKKYDDDLKKMMKDFYFLGSDIHGIFRGEGCESLKVKNIFTIYSKTGNDFMKKYSKEKINHSFYMIKNSFDRECGRVINIYSGKIK